MNMSAQSMDNHLNFRMSSHDKKMIETAARLQGLKPNTYARRKLLEAAEKDIIEMSQLNSLILNPTDWEYFLNIMEAPVRVNQNLKKAVKNFRKTFGEPTCS
jgi:uncharacterized protein (DUF1778 family)